MKNREKVIAVVAVVAVALAIVIGFRIYTNVIANQERAARATQGRKVAVSVGRAVKRDVQAKLVFSASLEPFWTADISPKVDGRVAILNFDEGDSVRAGSVVATLDNDELVAQVTQAEGNLYSARANLEQAELDLGRTSQLARQDAVSTQALDTARIKRDLAVGQLRVAEGNLAQLRTRLDYANIIAPRDGLITKRYLQAGYYAKAGSPIVSLADVSSMLVKASVGEAEISQLKVGLPAVVRIAALGDKEFSGTITRLTPAASLPARTFTAEVTIPNGEGLLKTGLFAQVEIAGEVHKNVLAVPESALVMREDQKAIYIVLPDNTVQLRILKLGSVGDGWAEVLGGINENESIVTGGQNKLRDGASINAAVGEGEN